jgi:hypothetical protein
MPRVILAIVLLCFLTLPARAAEAPPAAKPPANYFRVEIRGTLKIAGDGHELVDLQGIAFAANVLGTGLVFGDNRDLLARAKTLDGKKVLIRGDLQRWSPLTAGPPTHYVTYVAVTALEAAPAGDAGGKPPPAEWNRAAEAKAEAEKEAAQTAAVVAQLKGLVVSASLKQSIGSFSSFGAPAVGNSFEIDFDKLPTEKLTLTAAEPGHGSHYIPFSGPLRIEYAKQGKKVTGPARTVINLSAGTAGSMFRIQVLAEGLEKGSKVRVILYRDSGFAGSMAEGEGVVK